MPRKPNPNKTCSYMFANGDKCGADSGSSFKCETHKEPKCVVCGKPAWKDCPKCGVALCRKGTCFLKHTTERHGGKPPTPLAQSAARVDIQAAEGAYPCPSCERAEPDMVTTMADKRNKSEVQVVCPECKTAGPVCKSMATVLKRWNLMPRGRPAVYEHIRRTALGLIDRALAAYESERNLGCSDYEAIAKMLEAATMAVDTWEM